MHAAGRPSHARVPCGVPEQTPQPLAHMHPDVDPWILGVTHAAPENTHLPTHIGHAHARPLPHCGASMPPTTVSIAGSNLPKRAGRLPAKAAAPDTVQLPRA